MLQGKINDGFIVPKMDDVKTPNSTEYNRELNKRVINIVLQNLLYLKENSYLNKNINDAIRAVRKLKV